ncbi:hypothetical protein ACVW1A_001393 [Bradyrhizobium sp. LB1.3]
MPQWGWNHAAAFPVGEAQPEAACFPSGLQITSSSILLLLRLATRWSARRFDRAVSGDSDVCLPIAGSSMLNNGRDTQNTAGVVPNPNSYPSRPAGKGEVAHGLAKGDQRHFSGGVNAGEFLTRAVYGNEVRFMVVEMISNHAG